MLPQPAVGTSIRSNSIRQMPQASSQPVGAERNALAQSMQMMGAVMSFPRNSEIFGENEPADYVYRVIGGSVRTYKILSDGRRQIGGFYLPGDIFGLEVGKTHQFSAEAINQSTVTVIRRSAVVSLAERDCEVARELWNFTGRELHRVQEHMMLLVKSAQ